MASVARPQALVVGGSSGIGAACVDALAAAGWDVLVADLAPDPDQPGVLRSAQVDVRDGAAVDQVVEYLVGRGGTLDAVVHAAGTARVSPLEQITAKSWNFVLDVNLSGAFHVIHAAAPKLGAGGSIVLISSVDSMLPVSGLASYCAAKAGVDALSRSTALELGPRGIRCNVVAPGVVRTPLMEEALADDATSHAFLSRTPLGRIPDASEIASVVAFLASPAAGWVTGARIPVDGGLSLREHPSMLPSTPAQPSERPPS